MTTELSTEFITHKLIIKWETKPRYITNKVAQAIFQQLTDPNKNTVSIINYEKMSYLNKYKTEIELVELDTETRSFEDKLIWLTATQKEKVRELRDDREKEWKRKNDMILQNIITYIKTNEQ